MNAFLSPEIHTTRNPLDYRIQITQRLSRVAGYTPDHREVSHPRFVSFVSGSPVEAVPRTGHRNGRNSLTKLSKSPAQ